MDHFRFTDAAQRSFNDDGDNSVAHQQVTLPRAQLELRCMAVQRYTVVVDSQPSRPSHPPTHHRLKSEFGVSTSGLSGLRKR